MTEQQLSFVYLTLFRVDIIAILQNDYDEDRILRSLESISNYISSELTSLSTATPCPFKVINLLTKWKKKIDEQRVIGGPKERLMKALRDMKLYLEMNIKN